MTKDGFEYITANLTALSKEALSVFRRRLAHLYGLARGFSGDALFSSPRIEYDKLINAILPLTEYSDELCNDTGIHNKLELRADKLMLCSFINEGLRDRGAPLSAELLLGCVSDENTNGAPVKISYVRNYYSDKAYNAFTSAIANSTVSYSSDFNGVCEDVYYGRSKYCILPIESFADGILSGFRSLINKYELNLILTCDVQTQGGGMFTRFALLHKGIIARPLSQGMRLFELSATFGGDGATLCDVLDAAEEYGLELRHINSLPASYSGRSGNYDLAFCFGDSGLPEFIMFLSLEVPQFEALGIYTHISVK